MRKADNLPPSCAVVAKSGTLNFLEPSGPDQACNGTALPLLFLEVVFKYLQCTLLRHSKNVFLSHQMLQCRYFPGNRQLGHYYYYYYYAYSTQMSSKILGISLPAYSAKSLFWCPMNSVICKSDQ